MVKASVLYIYSIYNPFEIKQTSLSGLPTTLELKKFQDFLNSMGLILNSIQGHSTTILCLRKGAGRNSM